MPIRQCNNMPSYPMPDMCSITTRNRLEAARLIELARALLPRIEEAMAVCHLDHALEVLDSLTGQPSPLRTEASDTLNLPAPAPGPDHDSQEREPVCPVAR